jgi:hypothetical protein
MSTVLFALGLIGVVAGLAMIGFGIPINEFSLGNTLIFAGTTALTGGLILFGLGAAVAQLQRISDVLAARPVPRPGRQPEAFEPQAPGGRSSGPGQGRVNFPPKTTAAWSGSEQQPMDPHYSGAPSYDAVQESYDRPAPGYAPMPRYPNEPQAYAPEYDEAPLAPVRQHAPAYAPSYAPPARPNEVPDDAYRGQSAPKPPGLNGSGARHEPNLDAAAWRNAPPLDRPPQTVNFDAIWPGEQRANEQRQAEQRQAKAEPAPRQPWQPEPAAAPAAEPRRNEQALRPSSEPRAVAVLKTGVVDGMNYTLYVDGSIEADLPQGMLRFASINDLRNHLEKNS